MFNVEKLKERLSAFGYKVRAEDAASLSFCLEKVRSTVRNRTHLKDVPEGLEHIAIDMAAGKFLQTQKSFAPETLAGIDLGSAVKQIQEGDTNIVFAIGEGSLTQEQRLDIFINYLLSYGKDEILTFRRIQW